MAAATKRAQNYIPISKQNKNRMKFAAEPQRIKTQQGNLSYIEDRRIQNMPSSPRKVGSGYYTGEEQRPRKSAPRPVYPRNAQAARVSAQGGIAIPLPQTKERKQPGKQESIAANPAATGVVSTILLIAAVFAILSFLMVRNAAITNLSLENADIQKRISTLSQDIDQLKRDITLKEDLGAISERAAALNMSAPTGNQITYLPEQMAAVVSVPQDTPETALEEKPFSLDDLFKTLKSWIE